MKKENSDFLSGIESILSTRPSKLLWLVPSLIGMLVLFIILWLTFSQIDVIAPSLGKTIPSSRMILIQAKETSTIEKINVKNGQSVKKGDLLVEFRNNVENFDNSSMKAKYETLLLKKIFLEEMLKYIDTNNKEKEIENNEISPTLLKLVNDKLNSHISSYYTEVKSLNSKIEKVVFEKKMIETEVKKLLKLLPFTQYKLEQMKKLVEKGLEPEISLKDLEEKYIEEKSNISIKEDEINKLSIQYEISKQELIQFKNNTKKELLEEFNKTTDELSTTLPEVNKSNYLLESKVIYAIEDGFIYNLNNGTSGRVVQSGEVIMELIPTSSPLEVEAKVLNRDIGFVHVGQEVKVKIDSFKFTKYGYIEGVVTNIAKSSILDEKLGEIYPVLIELKKDTMRIDDKNIKLIPGMTCSVDIKIGKRRLIEYIISPMIRYKDEALREQ
ncbi:HlyD family type I secretion periplasmic adaptor subunit [Aliarcobacter cryaerophilus]|uniref:HlyD family type I secretion periplasmic adaptor subunit n=1 Tax=Aliarcobacter cryaerophilus TaxID=28198 RepID=UPI00083199E1|nr:HlyD family type I secretion periplasmic adaptor subunit [Aliarcobacter cryaerophilus]MCT7406560.1 HlyD family type I secretion periplasmic adaptor subunit [Aliarcobacter cryaerophilus]MCT7445310.1 HlyD family type I secretion periplasmic adaptor subunit [Aliarcobacter cryaerophilus]MCT7480130.1 HlyD family type I secretion periplasmic adaptor subunit [Aliarcobacter cryaerophilus]MCT7489246.1 HlyD family type I secretion periplasmic adaptor subunit [Aliarcobacter cryaerophilus]MCT7504296.1 